MDSTTLIRLGAKDHGRLVSDQEFADAEFEEPWTYEREHGRLIVLAPEGTGHLLTSNPWRDQLIVYKFLHPGVIEEVVGQAWVRIPGGGDRIGDLGVYLVRQPPTFEVPEQAPELMFEIVSRSRADRDRDYVAKRADYHAIGVREYVIVDRFSRQVLVLRWDEHDYQEARLTPDHTYTTSLLPGLAIPLSEIFGK